MPMKTFLIALFAALTLSLAGCAKKEEGTMEKVGKSLDNAAEEVEKTAEDAADEIKKATEE
jgi:predicted small secreted protein